MPKKYYNCRLVPLIKKQKKTEETRVETVVSSTTIGTLPESIDEKITTFLLDIDLSGGDIEVTGWRPSNIREGTTVQIRKVDASTHKIIFTSRGVKYKFADKKGEFVNLIWTGSDFRIT